VDLSATGTKAASTPQSPADGASARDASGGSTVAGGKWGPYSNEARIRKALLGTEPPLEDPLAPYAPELGQAAIGFVPGLNSYAVLQDPNASTAGKALAVGTDVLAVVGVGTIIKAAKTGSALFKAVVGGAEVVEGAGKAAAQGGVYVLLNETTGAVMRSGRSIDLVRRRTEHFRDPVLKVFKFKTVFKTNIKAEQRGLEQYLHNLHAPPLNKIRPISPLNPRGPGYMRAAQEFLEQQ
jgi:hypothetical protein